MLEKINKLKEIKRVLLDKQKKNEKSRFVCFYYKSKQQKICMIMYSNANGIMKANNKLTYHFIINLFFTDFQSLHLMNSFRKMRKTKMCGTGTRFIAQKVF